MCTVYLFMQFLYFETHMQNMISGSIDACCFSISISCCIKCYVNSHSCSPDIIRVSYCKTVLLFCVRVCSDTRISTIHYRLFTTIKNDSSTPRMTFETSLASFHNGRRNVDQGKRERLKRKLFMF